MKVPSIRGECHPVFVGIDCETGSQLSVRHLEPTIVVQLSARVMTELATHGLCVPTFKFIQGEAADCPLLIIGLGIGTHEHRIVADIGDDNLLDVLRQAEGSNTISLSFKAEGGKDAVQRHLIFPENFLQALHHFGTQAAPHSLPQRLGDVVVAANRLSDLTSVPTLSETFKPKSTSIGVVLTGSNAKLLQPVIAASKGKGQVFH